LKTIANIWNIQIKNSYNIYVKHIHRPDKTLVMSRSKLGFGLNQSEVPEKNRRLTGLGKEDIHISAQQKTPVGSSAKAVPEKKNRWKYSMHRPLVHTCCGLVDGC
jgi:hypothetical protein